MQPAFADLREGSPVLFDGREARLLSPVRLHNGPAGAAPPR
eukprot:gene396-692_t